MSNRQAYLDREHRFTIREEAIPIPADDEVVVRIAANGICGSDIHFYREGRLGNFIVTVPYIPGHEASGEVCAAGKAVRSLREGDRVVIEPGIPCGTCAYCRSGRYNLCPHVEFLSAPPVNGTFCDYLAVPAHSVHLMPEGMSYAQGALVEPVAVAVHAVNRSGAHVGETGCIVGCGPIGLLTLQTFLASGGTSALCIDTSPARLAVAEKLGASATVKPDDRLLESFRADIVFETAGADAATKRIFGYAKPGGKVVQVGWPGSTHVSMPIADFLERELTYYAVNRYANAFPAAIALIASGRIATEELVTHRFPFDEIERAFAFTRDNPGEVIKTLVEN